MNSDLVKSSGFGPVWIMGSRVRSSICCCPSGWLFRSISRISSISFCAISSSDWTLFRSSCSFLSSLFAFWSCFSQRILSFSTCFLKFSIYLLTSALASLSLSSNWFSSCSLSSWYRVFLSFNLLFSFVNISFYSANFWFSCFCSCNSDVKL